MHIHKCRQTSKGVGRKISRGGGDKNRSKNSKKTPKNSTIRPFPEGRGGNGKKTEK